MNTRIYNNALGKTISMHIWAYELILNKGWNWIEANAYLNTISFQFMNHYL